jgi:hypothetical protein
MRSKQYRRLLVAASVIGVVVSLVSAAGFVIGRTCGLRVLVR